MHIFRLLASALAAALLSAPAAAELPAPELKAAFPPDHSETAAPVSEITLTFAATTDLVEVVVITPDQRRIVLHDVFNGSEERKGDTFTFPLPEAVNLPGTYLIEISASVTDFSDSSASSLSTYSSFIIPDATTTQTSPESEPQ